MIEKRLVNVAVPLPLEGALTYSVPDSEDVPLPGVRVLVPVGRRQMAGICLGHAEPPGDNPFKIRSIGRVLDQSPIVSDSLLRFLFWISDYYFYPIGQVISEALPPGFLSARSMGISRIIEKGTGRGRSRYKFENWKQESGFSLTSEQGNALFFINSSIHKKQYQPVLLHGVTGSGKTEVYLRATAACLETGRSVLVMVPEIAMTTQTTGWFAGRFGELLAVLHSGMTDAQRRDQWWRIRSGESPVVVGTRSAIFAPLADIGLIIVDEEHDSSYKQSEKLRYNARDMALVLGRFSNATVVLGSATPSLSSYSNAVKGKYQLIRLDKRVSGRRLPDVTVVDRRKNADKNGGRRKKSAKGTWLTPELEAAISETLSRKEQVALFLNRRGFATYIFCPECGHVFRCRNCDVTMTWHRATAGASGFLKCHYCGDEAPALPVCPSCGGQAVKALGYGTEKVESEVRKRFPDITTARIDRDIISSARRLSEVINSFRNGDIDLVVGTQMITKGHDFPGLTLVGILWADMGLNVPEFNAAEKSFQLITQVAGRAGRGDRPGRVLVQTFMADHFAIKTACAQDYEAFYHKEAALRSQLGYAPFARMINFRLSGTKKEKVFEAGERLSKLAREVCADISRSFREDRHDNSVDILGPAPAPRARIKNRYRGQLLLKSRSITAVRRACRIILDKKDQVIPASVRLEIDVDPDSML